TTASRPPGDFGGFDSAQPPPPDEPHLTSGSNLVVERSRDHHTSERSRDHHTSEWSRDHKFYE
ncbi:MAG: hypothetical protein V1775_06140, partial [Bacteroidota bacterium]